MKGECNMNLKNFKGEYYIGLDLGTASCGWSVVDVNGKLFHFRKRPVWGSRLFKEANPAKNARKHRPQRRRYIRRRWRLNLLQEFFIQEIQKVDKDFFIRLNQSSLHKSDRDEACCNYRWPIFNDSDFTEKDYYKKFPTIYHLRKHLMESNEPEDIRLVYLALHNIVKCRGNFLREGQELNSAHADPKQEVKALEYEVCEWCKVKGYGKPTFNTSAILKALKGTEKRKEKDEQTGKQVEQITYLKSTEIAEKIQGAITVKIGTDKENSNFLKALSKAIVGLKANFAHIFGSFADDAEDERGYLSNEGNVESLLSKIPSDGENLFNSLCSVYSAYVLQDILSYAPGKSISVNMVEKYNQYKCDLQDLKGLVKDYKEELKKLHGDKNYSSFFRGERYATCKKMYNKQKARYYTAYDLGSKDYKTFKKELVGTVNKNGDREGNWFFKGTKAEKDKRFKRMAEAFETEHFLRRQKTSDNGSIPYQLHLEEMKAIIKKQGKYYPFLLKEQDKIESLVTFRIPYYVGPLTSKNAPTDAKGKKRFCWAERNAGKENATIKPWNWFEVIDKRKSAKNFITRMTGQCTYLLGQDVLPRHSLLYEEYCLLNELNGIKFTYDGDTWHKFTPAVCKELVEDLGYKGSFTYDKIKDALKENNEPEPKEIKGGQADNGLESKLEAHIFFAKDVFKVEKLDRNDFSMIEKIIRWSTLFEDRSILKETLEEKYGKNGSDPKFSGRLNSNQIKTIYKKRFKGWGRLSRKFLKETKVEIDSEMYSIIRLLREGNPFKDPSSKSLVPRTVNLMQIIYDNNLAFQDEIENHNKQYLKKLQSEEGDINPVNELPGSPKLRRGLNQGMRIVDEIARIAGHAPAKIFVEVTRDGSFSKKGKKTKSRYKSLNEATNKLQEELKKNANPSLKFDLQVEKELKQYDDKKKKNALQNDKVFLYFAQHGKCMYSGKPLSLETIINGDGKGEYEIDHIIPRCYIPDDSLENSVLVFKKENQRKGATLLLDASIQKKMKGIWESLHSAGLMSDKKFRSLTRTTFRDNELGGFIARQLVETSQVVKHMQLLLEAKYAKKGTKVIPVKAGMVSNLRKSLGLAKCRGANHYHHAHDAFLSANVGLFIQKRYPLMYENPVQYARMQKEAIKKLSETEEFKNTHKIPGSNGFIVDSFLKDYEKKKGQEDVDIDTEGSWDANMHVQYIQKAINYPQCFITRMPYVESGAFWDQTIYSPRNEKTKKYIPLKTGKCHKGYLDAKLYGGYSEEQFAYFFVFKAKDQDENIKYCFRPVPRTIASKAKSSCGLTENELVNYAKEILAQDNENAMLKVAKKKAKSKRKTNATPKKFSFVEIVCPRILKWQLIEVDGKRFFITGKAEWRSCSQIPFSHEECALLHWGEQPDDVERPEVSVSFKDVLNKISHYEKHNSCRVLEQIKFDKLSEELLEKDEKEALKALLKILKLVNADSNKENLKCTSTTDKDLPTEEKKEDIAKKELTGKKNAGTMCADYSKEINNPKSKVYLINQSVTGMFESKRSIKGEGR